MKVETTPSVEIPIVAGWQHVWTTRKLTISTICRTCSGALPKFNQLFFSSLSTLQISRKQPLNLFSYPNNTQIDKRTAEKTVSARNGWGS